MRGHAHQAAEADVLEFLRPEKDVEDLLLLETLLGLLGTDVHLEEDADHAAVGLAPVLDRVQQVLRVHGLHEVRVRQHHLELVGLQVTDEMPLQVEIPEGLDLGGKFLRTVLAEATLAGGIRLPDGFGGMEFGNCHQLDFRWQFLIDCYNILLNHYLRFCWRICCSCIFWASSRRCCHLLLGSGLPAEARTFARISSLLMERRISQVCTIAISCESR